MKLSLFISIVFVLSLSWSAYAADVTSCKQGAVERRIEVTSTSAEAKVPCEVKYFKEGVEAGTVLWSAQNDAEYCATKAKELADKLSGLGWQCTNAAETSATPTPTIAPTPNQ